MDLRTTQSALLLSLLAGCESPPTHPQPPTEAVQRPPGSPVGGAGRAADDSLQALDAAEAERAGEAIDAARAGNFERARDILGELLVARHLREAARLMDAGRPREALLPLDDAVDLDPTSAETWYRRGRAAFATAPGDSQPQFFYEDALSDFERAAKLGQGPIAALYASRAARMAGDNRLALDYARRAVARPPAPGEDDGSGVITPQRALAEAAFGVYVEKKAAEEDANDLFVETERTLQSLIGTTPEEPWSWLQLANLYQWEERLDDAQSTLESALRVLPEDESLHNRMVAIATTRAGRDAVFEYYARFSAAHPDLALGVWYPAVQRFELAIEEFRGEPEGGPVEPDAAGGADEGTAQEESAPGPSADGAALEAATQARTIESCANFLEAEQAFRECRRLEPAYEDACLGYEVMCRAGVGWCEHLRGDLQASKEAFLSTEDVLEGGLTWQIEGRLGSGLLGLELVLFEYSKNPQDTASMVNAAAIADYIHAYLPEDADKANNAGFFNRDAAVLLENEALLALFRAGETDDAAERAELERQAERLRARAVELMQRSFAAYEEAVRLNPDDVRVVNDTGLVMTYYLRDNIEAAERYLSRAIELGREQLAETDLEGQDLIDLKEAWGDAHQNMGLLHLTLKGEPQEAKRFFETCVEIGPPEVPRSLVQEKFIPLCERVIAGDTAALKAGLDPYLVWTHRDDG